MDREELGFLRSQAGKKTQDMFGAPQETASTLGIAERRMRARLQPTALIFLDLGGANGGFVYNITEGGMALSAAVPVFEDQQIGLRMQFPESEDWIEAQGRVIWKSKSKKEIGLDFVDLSGEARKRIRSFMLSEGCAELSPREEVAESAAHSQQSGELQELPQESSTDTIEGPGTRAAETRDTAGVWFEQPAASEAGGEFRALDSVALPETAGAAAQAGTERDQPEAQEALEAAGSRPLLASRTAASKQRAYPRVRIVPLGYLQLGESNGGIALDISEGGVAISTALALANDGCLPSVRLQFPDTVGWVETSGEIAWISESKKEAGVRFVGLSETARQQIREWVATQLPASIVQPQENGARNSPNADPDGSTSFDLAINVYGAPVPREETRTAAQNASVPAISEGTLSRPQDTLATAQPLPLTTRIPNKSWLELRSRFDAAPNGRAWRATRRTLSAVVVATCCLWLAWNSAFRRGNFWEKTKATAAQTASLWKDKPENPVVPSSPVTKPSIAASSKAREAVASNPPLPPLKPPQIASRPAEILKPQPAHVVLPPKLPKETARKVQAGRAQRLPAQKPQRDQFARVAANVNNQPVERVARTVNASPPTAPQLDAGMASPSNLVPLLASEVRPVAPEATKSVPPPSAQPTAPPEFPTRPSGAITILADSYPSLRVDGKMAKKERNGASLQLGRLFSRVEPVYPEEAKQQGIQGDVKLHAVIDRHGAVENVQTLNGPPQLVAAALNAVRQWRYTQTLLAGKAVETEEDIEIMFRLRDAAGTKK